MSDQKSQPRPARGNRPKIPDSQRLGSWSFLFACLIIIILVIFVILQNNSLLKQQTSKSDTQVQPEGTANMGASLVATRSYVGDIGIPAENGRLKVTVNKLDCSRHRLEDAPSSEGSLTGHGAIPVSADSDKWCLVSMVIENISDDRLNLDDYGIYLKTFVSTLNQRDRYLQSDVMYKDTDHKSTLVRTLPSRLNQGKQVKAVLAYRIDRYHTPYNLIVLSDGGREFLSVYLDDQSDQFGFRCRDEQEVEVEDIFRDCAYEYKYESLDCNQVFRTPGNFSGRICFAKFTATNISHLPDVSPYIPNVSYHRISSAFVNHSLHLVDSQGHLHESLPRPRHNWLESVAGDHGIKYPETFKKPLDVLAPGESTSIFSFFVIPEDAKIEALRLMKNWHVYYNSLPDNNQMPDSGEIRLPSTDNQTLMQGDQPETTPAELVPPAFLECPTCGRR